MSRAIRKKMQSGKRRLAEQEIFLKLPMADAIRIVTM